MPHTRPMIVTAMLALGIAAVCAAQPLRVYVFPRHLTKAELGVVEGTSPFVLVEARRDWCPWCDRLEQDVLPDFRRRYIDTGVIAFCRIQLGPPSPFTELQQAGLVAPMLIVGRRTEDGGLDILARHEGATPAGYLERMFTQTGLLVLVH